MECRLWLSQREEAAVCILTYSFTVYESKSLFLGLHASENDSDDENARFDHTSSGVPTWVLKEPAEGCVFERLPRDDDIHIVVELDEARNRTGREFMKIRAEGFDDKVIESFTTKKGETRIVGGWRLMPDGFTWKACNCDELRN